MRVLIVPLTHCGVLGKLFYSLCLRSLLFKIGIIMPHEVVVQNEKDNAWKVTGTTFDTLINGPTCYYHYNGYNNTNIINNLKIVMFPKIMLLRELFTPFMLH